MSVDFQVAFPQEQVPLSQVQVIPGPPRLLDIVGTDFRSVDEVLINSIPAADVIVLSKTRLLAQLPDSLNSATSSLVSVSVLSNRLTITSKSFIRFRIGSTPGRTTGILRLVQLFLKLLFTTPGSDIFSPDFGGAGLRNLGSTFGIDQGGEIISDFHIAVTNTARQIVAIQGRDPRIPRDERLLSARIVRAGFNRQEGTLVVSVELTSQAGRAALANLEL